MSATSTSGLSVIKSYCYELSTLNKVYFTNVQSKAFSCVGIKIWNGIPTTIPDKKVGTASKQASKLSSPPNYNVDNRLICFSPFVGKNVIFCNID